MSEMKSAVGAGMDRSGDDLCVENSVHEFKIWADVLNYGKKILKNAGIVEADMDLCRVRYQSALYADDCRCPEMNPSALTSYPGLGQSVAQVIHNTDERCRKLQ